MNNCIRFLCALTAALEVSANLSVACADDISEMRIMIDVTNEAGAAATLRARLCDNSSAAALYKRLLSSPITIEMHDFSNFEKVGELGFELPRNDEPIAADYGDLILYLGSQFVVYYDKNNWNFTRLGKIENVSQSELKKILGKGNVSALLRAR